MLNYLCHTSYRIYYIGLFKFYFCHLKMMSWQYQNVVCNYLLSLIFILKYKIIITKSTIWRKKFSNLILFFNNKDKFSFLIFFFCLSLSIHKKHVTNMQSHNLQGKCFLSLPFIIWARWNHNILAKRLFLANVFLT